MNSNQRTSIDDLDAIGNELTEEYLRLAAGSGPSGTIHGSAGLTAGKVDVSGGFTITFGK